MKNSREIIETYVRAVKPNCPILPPLLASHSRFEIEQLNVGEKLTNHLVWMEKPDENMKSELRKKSTFVKTVSRHDFWIESHSCTICRVISKIQAIPISVKPAPSNGLIYKLFLPDKKLVPKLKILLDETGEEFHVSEGDQESVGESLTMRQREILLLALREGYFDMDRKISLTDLAKKIGVSTKTLQETLRRATKKVVQDYVIEKL